MCVVAHWFHPHIHVGLYVCVCVCVLSFPVCNQMTLPQLHHIGSHLEHIWRYLLVGKMSLVIMLFKYYK